MNVLISEDFVRVRGLKSIAPCNVADFDVGETKKISHSCVSNHGNPLIYAFGNNLDDVMLTIHKDVEILKGDSFFFQAQFRDADFILKSSSHLVPEIVNCQVDESPIFIVSPGRVGSTLLSEVLKYGGVECLSEPDALSSFKISSYERSNNSFKIKFKYLLEKTILSYVCHGRVIKLRSYSASLVPLISQIFPKAKFIFLYRDICDWTSSMIRVFNYNDQDLSWVLNQFLNAFEFVKARKREYIVLNYKDISSENGDGFNNLSDFLDSDSFDIKGSKRALRFDSQRYSGIGKEATVNVTASKTELEDVMNMMGNEVLIRAADNGFELF